MFYRKHKRVQFSNPPLLDAKGKVQHDKTTGEVVLMPSATKQSFVEECDINNIVKLYKKTGQFNHMSANASKGVYTDLPEESDFQSALGTVFEARAAFATLPSLVRERFENDPARFLAFMSNPDNLGEAIKMGLAIERASQDPSSSSSSSSSSSGGPESTEPPPDKGE